MPPVGNRSLRSWWEDWGGGGRGEGRWGGGGGGEGRERDVADAELIRKLLAYNK